MKPDPLREVARKIVERSEGGEDLISAIVRLVEEDRRRIVSICRKRAELWRRTLSRGREESRARANEATYLADLIESNQEVASDDAEPAN